MQRMSASTAYPLFFSPVYKDYIWGGDRIPRLFDREPCSGICAESWEVSDREEGQSIVRNGPLAGRGLSELVATDAEALLGRVNPGGGFPLLVKLIDARQRLSVQVHPDDEAAARYGGEAKTEMWYVLEAEADACVFAGVRPGTTADDFRAALEEERLEDVLNAVPVKPGMAVFMPGGRVHAIGEGCLLLEVQQNSNTTYRVYDWGRLGHDGKPRDLHIKQAFEVIRWADEAPLTVNARELSCGAQGRRSEMLCCPYFRMEKLELGGPQPVVNDGRSFHVLFAETGRATIRTANTVETLAHGACCLLPASLENYTLTPEGGRAALVRISVP